MVNQTTRLYGEVPHATDLLILVAGYCPIILVAPNVKGVGSVCIYVCMLICMYVCMYDNMYVCKF